MQIMLPKNVKRIITTLEEHGYEAYAVGGCVRDSILGRVPDDWDITTSAKPEETKALFKRTIDTGIQHGTITVMLDSVGYEVTTYRLDGEYEDSRHPKEVTFTADLVEDLKRRDFTINAMAYNDTRGLVDVFDGAGDLERKIIRCVGNAEERFTEDVLRILRAVRFSAQLGFTIEEETKLAIRKLAGNLEHISAERIQTEFLKLMVSANPQYMEDAYNLGITAVIMPEFDVCMKTEQNTPHHIYTVGGHTLEALKMTRSDKVIRLAVFFHDFGKPGVRWTDENGRDRFKGHDGLGAEMAQEIMRRLRFDNDTLNKVVKLIKYHGCHPEPTARNVRRLMNRVGEELFPLLLEVQRADVLAHSPASAAARSVNLEKIEQLYAEILANQECFSMKDLAVTGRDLIADGMKPGKELGEVLNRLLDHVLEEPEHNTKEYLIEYSKSFR